MGSLTLTTTHSTIHDTMKPFVVTLLALAAASAEINVAPGGPSGPNNLMGTSSNIVGQNSASGGLPTSVFAESRNAGDSYGAPSAPIIDSYSSSSWIQRQRRGGRSRPKLSQHCPDHCLCTGGRVIDHPDDHQDHGCPLLQKLFG